MRHNEIITDLVARKMEEFTTGQSAIMIFLEVFPDCDPKLSPFFTTSMPSTTCPKTTCLPSSHWVLAVQRKNWDPLVLGPALAMERPPGPVCFRVKFSSSNLFP